MVLKKTLESPLDCKEIQPGHSEDQSWDFFGRNDAKAETPVLGHLMRTVDSLEKTVILGEIRGRRRGEQELALGCWGGVGELALGCVACKGPEGRAGASVAQGAMFRQLQSLCRVKLLCHTGGGRRGLWRQLQGMPV